MGLSPAPILGRLPPEAIRIVPFSVWNAMRRLTWPQLLAFITFPICATKQVRTASCRLVTLNRPHRPSTSYNSGKRPSCSSKPTKKNDGES